uniref:Uncharacterized protein n=1 Tax=Anguilla anguilla TaxID=7936 RepID=A0A0E9WJB6_ANGAN
MQMLILVSYIHRASAVNPQDIFFYNFKESIIVTFILFLIYLHTFELDLLGHLETVPNVSADHLACQNAVSCFVFVIISA